MQYRLYFRFHVESKIIALGRVSDEDTRRAYGATDDAYREARTWPSRKALIAAPW